MENESTLRVMNNIQILLRNGVFSGEVAAALAESQQFVSAIVADLEKKVKVDGGKEAKPSVQRGKGARRVGRRGVSDPGRKGSEEKTDGA